ncbi:MAG: hypothetical protein ABFD97_14715 [Syntrophobacter sp.]
MQGEQSGKAFERRIKKHIVGPVHRFAVVVPGELSQICLREVKELGIEGAELTDAGVEFEGKVSTAYLCNLRLRTASRILCRLAPFRAGVAEELFYKTADIPWELWINREIPLHVEAHVENSRISHEGRVVELVSEGIERSIKDAPGMDMVRNNVSGTGAEVSASQDLRQRILVRLIRNHCRISLDMTGRHLHERGYRLQHSGAPLRETLAAAILLKMEWNGDTPLVDGMCGSGTFPIEGAMIAGGIAPGQGRSFLFERWPSFQAATWRHLRKTAKLPAKECARTGIWGIDIQGEAIRISKENAVRAGVGGDIGWKEMDFFDFDPREEKLRNGLLVLNPPYGRRLEGGGGLFHDKLGDHLRRVYKGWKYAVLSASRAEAGAMKMPLMRLWSFRHGGTLIYAALGRVP